MNKDTSEAILEELSNITTNNDLDVNDLNLTFAIFEAIVQGNVISTNNKTKSERIGQVCCALLLVICDNFHSPIIFTNHISVVFRSIAYSEYC